MQPVWRRGALLIVGIIIVVWTLAPLVWLLLVATLPPVDLASQPTIIDLTQANFGRFGELLADERFTGAMLNSLQAAGLTTIVCVAVASLAAYALARFEMRGKAILLGGALATQMVPGIVLVIPIFIIMRQLRLTDTIASPWSFSTRRFCCRTRSGCCRTSSDRSRSRSNPAARMDGCTRLGALFRIVLPISAPGVAATAIFVFISSWNEFLFALVLTSQKATTVTIRLAQIQSTIFGGENFGNVGAAAVLMVLPVILIVIIFNRYISYGLTEGAIRG